MEQSSCKVRRCAIYTRKSSAEGLEQDFNSLHAQRDACESFIKSQAAEGWRLVKTAYDDGGLSGATMERPGLQRLLSDIGEKLIDVVVVYKVDRLTCVWRIADSGEISNSPHTGQKHVQISTGYWHSYVHFASEHDVLERRPRIAESRQAAGGGRIDKDRSSVWRSQVASNPFAIDRVRRLFGWVSSDERRSFPSDGGSSFL